MWRRALLVALITVVGSLIRVGGDSLGWAYEEMTVTSGGTITGRVLLSGTPPPARIFHLVFSPNLGFCGGISDGKGNRLIREFRVDDEGGLEGTVVSVVGVERGKKFSYSPRIELENCRITPFVTPIRNHEPITIVNKDSIVHDIQGYSLNDQETFAMFNKPMSPTDEATKEIRLRKGHYLFRTQCGVHDFMQSWGMAVGNPYFAVTGEHGQFTIPDLPAGEYDIMAWHPRMKVQAQRVRVSADGTATVSFRFDASEVEIPLHDLQTEYRLETALRSRQVPLPSVELQMP